MSNANPARAATQRMITRDDLLGLLDALPPEELGDLLDELGVDGQVATPALPDPSMLNYYCDLERRTIWLDTELNEEWLEYAKHILRWNREDEEAGIPIKDRKPIKLFFFSPGGDLDVNNCIIDVLQMSRTPTVGINMGRAYSGGAFTYLATQKRYVLPHASFLLHTGSAEFVSGTPAQIKSFSEQYNRQTNTLKDYLIEDVGMDAELVSKNIEGEWYIDAQEAVKIGMAHGIVHDIREIM